MAPSKRVTPALLLQDWILGWACLLVGACSQSSPPPPLQRRVGRPGARRGIPTPPTLP